MPLILIFLSILCSLSCINAGILGSLLFHQSSSNRSPVILVPGLGSQKFEMKINKTTVRNSWCKKQTENYENIWLDLTQFTPRLLDCLADNLKMNYNPRTHRTYNQPGVLSRVGQFGSITTTESVLRFLPSGKFDSNGLLCIL